VGAVQAQRRLRVVTTRAAHDRLVAYADPASPLAFVRSGDGLVGVGETLRITVSGATRIADGDGSR